MNESITWEKNRSSNSEINCIIKSLFINSVINGLLISIKNTHTNLCKEWAHYIFKNESKISFKKNSKNEPTNSVMNGPTNY